jgi:ABC-2 type transport system permease protein
MITLYIALLRMQATRTRLAVTGGTSLLVALTGLPIGLAAGAAHRSAGHALVNALGLGLVVPAISLVFAAATLGDLAEDGTLVYIWLRPIARWKLVAVTALAVMTVSLPLTVVPLCVAAALSGGGATLVLGTAAATMLSTVGYAGVFIGLGLVVRRALIWGLLYVLIWEGVVANIGIGPSRLSIHLYARSLLESIDGIAPSRGAVPATVGLVVVVAVALCALGLTTLRLAHLEVT